MNILLTGGTGFIGSHFLNQALNACHYVRALRRSENSSPRIKLLQQPEWLNCQLNTVTAAQLQGCDVLVHLSAHSVQYPFDSLAECLHWNLIAVLQLFDQARKAGIRHFVVAGSCFEYGKSGERYEVIPSDAPLEPTSSYAVSKASATLALTQWANEHHVNLDILRIFHVYGEGESTSRFWPSMRRAALAGDDFAMTAGEQIRDFIRVEDVANTFLLWATDSILKNSGSNIYNLGSGNPTSLASFATQYWNRWNAAGNLLLGSLNYRRNECMRLVPGPNLINVINCV
ncbi:NAD(P)-dependent oxidoreductase [Synechococcus sp. HK01-R]|uniref:NAD-dependent epimerase/dehydratase family protein n=1 Tax=Synechococcus sp. HK01-R TaxID=2751171 RepID=UPI0016287639|nr:NAD(P)-dependent oxidoreductase [Synechococcus sp. HK01-R]QNG27888.1 NAD(P)-dependent oxidoreductase [Synechococcus sp. HK01-R]